MRPQREDRRRSRARRGAVAGGAGDLRGAEPGAAQGCAACPGPHRDAEPAPADDECVVGCPRPPAFGRRTRLALERSA